MHLPPPLSLPCGGQVVLRAGGAAFGAFAGAVLALWLARLFDLSDGAASAAVVAAAAAGAGLVGLATRTAGGQLTWDGLGQWHLAPWPDGKARRVRPEWALDFGGAILLALRDDGPGRRLADPPRTWTIVRRGISGPRRWARVRTSLAWQQPAQPMDAASWAP